MAPAQAQFPLCGLTLPNDKLVELQPTIDNLYAVMDGRKRMEDLTPVEREMVTRLAMLYSSCSARKSGVSPKCRAATDKVESENRDAISAADRLSYCLRR